MLTLTDFEPSLAVEAGVHDQRSGDHVPLSPDSTGSRKAATSACRGYRSSRGSSARFTRRAEGSVQALGGSGHATGQGIR